MEEPSQPESAEEHLSRAYALEEEGRLEQALAECDAAIKAAEGFLADIFNLRGIILERLEREGEAVASYDTAIRLDPNLTEAADNLFELEAELGKGRELVTIATFSFPAQAHVMRGRLESEGIRAFVTDAGMVTANWLYSRAVGGVKVMVREGDVEQALKVLEMGEVEDEQVEEGGVEERCPSCDSSNVCYERYAIGAVFGSQLLLGVPLPFVKNKWRCRECGHEWKG